MKKICKVCKNEFNVKLSRIKIGKDIFCSRKCYTKYQKSLSPEKHNNWKGGISAIFRRKSAPRQFTEYCEICKKSKNDFKRGLCADHDHKTGKFRGWLCPRCNTAIGIVKENPKILLSMINYIKKHKK